jgi:hypothetical protein
MSTTFEIALKLGKNKKNLNFLPQVHMVSLHLPYKFQLKIILFDLLSELSKFPTGYVYFFEILVHMQVEGAWGMDSYGEEK